MKWYLTAFKKFADFKGRAGRAEYWFFALFNTFFAAVAVTADILLKTSFTRYGRSMSIGWVYSFYAVLVFVPTLSVTCRRLHDSDKSAWYFLIPVIATGVFFLCANMAIKKVNWHEQDAFYGWEIAAMILLGLGILAFAIILLQKGTKGTNRYGDKTEITTLTAATETILLLMIVVEGCTRVGALIWQLMAKKLSALANQDFHSYRKIQEVFLSIQNLWSVLFIFIFMGVPFLFKNKKMRIAVFIIVAFIALQHLYYEYNLFSKALVGE